jgi:hypothetical protein
MVLTSACPTALKLLSPLTPNVARRAKKRIAIVLMLSFDYFVYQLSSITKTIFGE